MTDKIELIYDSYLNKAKDLMEYKALITLPVYALKQHPEVLKKFKVGINYSLFSPVPIPTKEVDVNNFYSIFENLEKNYLSTSCLEKLVSIYEGYLFDLMKEIYLKYPQKLSSKKQIAISSILEAINKEELVYVVIARELNEIKYQSLDKWHTKLCDLFAVEQIDDNLTKVMVEIKSTRDLIVHNDGIINEIYIEKTKEKARGEIGNKISCEGDYFKESWATVVGLMTDIKKLIIDKYKE